MDTNLNLRIILEKPPPGVDFALQEGKGNNYQVSQAQKSNTGDLTFSFPVKLKNSPGSEPDFAGAFVQGTRGNRFVYIGIGTFAGQPTSPWSRRLKIPVTGITPEILSKLVDDANVILETRVPGAGKDGSPNCATVKPFSGWQLVKTKT